MKKDAKAEVSSGQSESLREVVRMSRVATLFSLLSPLLELAVNAESKTTDLSRTFVRIVGCHSGSPVCTHIAQMNG